MYNWYQLDKVHILSFRTLKLSIFNESFWFFRSQHMHTAQVTGQWNTEVLSEINACDTTAHNATSEQYYSTGSFVDIRT